jgi:DUF1680 family protein
VDNEGLQLHQYANSQISTALGDGRRVGVEVKTAYPHDGSVSIEVTESDPAPWALTLRVPSWATGASVTENGNRRPVTPGSVVVERSFDVGDRIELDLPMSARWTYPDPRIDSIRGTVAVERGPLVMCVESVDLPGEGGVDLIRVDAGADLVESDGVVFAPGRRLEFDDGAWPYDSSGDPTSHGSEMTVPLSPYHNWANRGPSTMRVWIPTN